MSIVHGTILGGLSTVPDMDLALAGYRDTLGLELLELGTLPADLAAAWNAPASTGALYAVLKVRSDEQCFVRLVEQPDHPDFVPTRTFGWGAFEFTVEDVWHWPDALPEDQFTIVGPPKVLENMEPAFIPMQALGTGQEMIYLNQVLGNMPDSDLPKAKSPVDRIFIVILATPDRAASIDWYCQRLGLILGETFTLPYSMINTAFGLEPDFQTTISVVRTGRMPIVEVDDYPAEATPRERHQGMLPPGNSLVTLAMRDLDDCDCEWISPPAVREGAMYAGRRMATTLGYAGELLELVEVG
jgi:catechol 2,3-dioxygenase-like lactoylglutathione lyase family enzyme